MNLGSNALNRGLRRLGHPGVLGIGILIACTMLWLSAIAPLREREAVARDSLASLRSERGARRPSGPSVVGLDAFYRFFANTGSATDRLARIFELARRAGVDLQKGAYKYVKAPGDRLAHYEISLPVRGTYVQIRAFLASVLNEIPIASLDQVAFRRQTGEAGKVEAELRLTLFLRELPASRTGSGGG